LILLPNVVDFLDLLVNLEKLDNLHIVHLSLLVSSESAHVEFPIALSTAREYFRAFLYSHLSSEAVEAEDMVARQLKRVCEDVQANPTTHLVI
jgi:hypothetical protein